MIPTHRGKSNKRARVHTFHSILLRIIQRENNVIPVQNDSILVGHYQEEIDQIIEYFNIAKFILTVEGYLQYFLRFNI